MQEVPDALLALGRPRQVSLLGDKGASQPETPETSSRDNPSGSQPTSLGISAADSGSSPPRIHPLKLDQLQYPQVILPEPQWLCFAFPLHRKAGGTLSPNPAPLEAGHFQTDLGMRKSSMFEMLLCLRAGNGRMTKGEETTRPPHLQGKHCSMTQPRY